MNEFERELRNTSINDVSLADYVKENYVPMSVIEDIKEEIYKERTNISFNLSEEKSKWVNSGIYDGLVWAEEIIDKHIEGR